MTKQIPWLLACILFAPLAQASEVFNEALSTVDAQVKEIVAAEREQARKSESKMRAELQAQYNAHVDVLAETFRRESAKQEARSEELRTQPSRLLASDKAADRAMRLAFHKSEKERRRIEWFYSALTVLAIAAGGFILFVEVRDRIKNKCSRP